MSEDKNKKKYAISLKEILNDIEFRRNYPGGLEAVRILHEETEDEINLKRELDSIGVRYYNPNGTKRNSETEYEIDLRQIKLVYDSES